MFIHDYANRDQLNEQVTNGLNCKCVARKTNTMKAVVCMVGMQHCCISSVPVPLCMRQYRICIKRFRRNVAH